MSLRDPAGARTQDPYIKSVLLYQLSYRVLIFEGCKYSRRFYRIKCFYNKSAARENYLGLFQKSKALLPTSFMSIPRKFR